MDQNQENNQKLKVKFSNFYYNNKIKIYCFVIILILSLISLVLIKSNNEKKISSFQKNMCKLNYI